MAVGGIGKHEISSPDQRDIVPAQLFGDNRACRGEHFHQLRPVFSGGCRGRRAGGSDGADRAAGRAAPGQFPPVARAAGREGHLARWHAGGRPAPAGAGGRRGRQRAGGGGYPRVDAGRGGLPRSGPGHH